MISKTRATGCQASPRSAARIAAICAAERLDRLASVRLQTLAPSRKDSRSSTVGVDPRFGTTSMCMGAIYARHTANASRLHGYIPALPRSANSLTTLHFARQMETINTGTSG